MPTLQLYFLGLPEIRCDGRQLSSPPTLKSQSLLAYLILHRSQPQPRDRLAGIFFGERPEHKARRSLSTSLWHIRRCLPDSSFILTDPHTVQFDPLNDLWLDTEEFEVLASRGDATALQAAVALYRGDFLDGFYDDWILSERYRLEAIYLETLARLMILSEKGKDYQTALATALRLLGYDALREDAHRLAMRAYCHLGQRKAALDQYERCRQSLLEELDLEPNVETADLYQAILEGRFESGFVFEDSQITFQPQLVGVSRRSPLDVLQPTRLVGRERELAFLEDSWQRAKAGEDSLALVRGEAGVGKTRLLEEFAQRKRWQGIRVLWGRCYEFERLLPYQPIVEALRTSLPTLPNGELAGLPAWVLFEMARLVPEVLEHPHGKLHRKGMGIPGPALTVAPGLDPQQIRFFEGVTRFIAELATKGELLIVLEDLHWASESTIQLLHHVARRLSDHPVLIIGTFRPDSIDKQHPLPALYRQLSREGVARQLDLARLSFASVATLIQEMSGAGEAVKPLVDRLYRETEGNPFFLMESVKTLFETNLIQIKAGVWQGDFEQVSEGMLPLSTGLNESVQARVQRLGVKAQAALRLAAVLGCEFDFEPFRQAWGKGEEATLEALDELLRHRLIEEQSGLNNRDFAFTHHKIQEVIYRSLPRHRCCHLHARVGEVMEAIYAEELETRSGELAYHYEQACLQDKPLTGKAIHYLKQAGQQAVRQYANQEAVVYYQRGLDILQSQPETKRNMQQEIELQIALGVPVMAIHGYTSPEIKRIYDRAYEQCKKVGDSTDLFTSLVGLSRFYGLTGDLETGDRLREQLLAIAQAANNPDYLLEAYRQMDGQMFAAGRLQEARKFCESGLDLYDPKRHESYAYRFGHDPAVTFLGFLSLTLWLLGYPDQAQEQSQKLYSLIFTMTNPSSQAYAYCHLAMHACMCVDAIMARSHAEAAIQLSQLHGLASWMALATALKGWAIFEQGQAAEGAALLEEGVQAWRMRGFTHVTPFLLSLQAEACLKMQKLKEGRDAVMAALEIGRRGGDQYWLAEINRLQGELLLACGGEISSVEAHFQQAVEIACKQEARMLELRAVMSLARLWHTQGRVQAAQALAQVYDRFTEGFDTSDLKAASALLQDLA